MLKAWKITFVLVILVLVTIVSAVTTISDRNIDLDSGIITRVTNISLAGTELMITDTNSNAVIAIFNTNIAEAKIQANELILSSNATISFFGDVDNFDNINAQSRFRETNINNGSSASSAFTAVNDLGFKTAFGIGSSQFTFAGIPLFNEAAIFHQSPGKFNMANDHMVGWNWRANRLNTSLAFDFIESMQLSGQGNLNIFGNFTGNQIYGEMFLFQLDNPITIDIVNLGLDNMENITNYSSGQLNGFRLEGDDALIALVSGVYKIEFNIVYMDQTNSRHGFGILKNGVLQENIAGATIILNANDIAPVSASGFVRLVEGDRINLGVGDRFAPITDVDVLSSNVNIVRVGH